MRNRRAKPLTNIERTLAESARTLKEARQIRKHTNEGILHIKNAAKWRTTGVIPKRYVKKVAELDRLLREGFVSRKDALQILVNGNILGWDIVDAWENSVLEQRRYENYSDFLYRVKNLESAQMIFSGVYRNDDQLIEIAAERKRVQLDLTSKAIAHGLIFDSVCNYNDLKLSKTPILEQKNDPLKYLYADQEHKAKLCRVHNN